MNSKDQELFDSLVATDGEQVKDSDYVVVESDKISDKVEKIVNESTKLLYETGGSLPLPGESISPYLDDVKKIDKESAINDLVAQSAMLKVQEEQKKQQVKPKLTKEQREQKKKQIVEYLMQQQEQAFFMEYHHIMDGRTRRRVRAKISRDYDKGKYSPRPNSKNLND